MRAVIQRVNSSSVSIAGEVVGSIQRGVLVFLAIAPNDSLEQGLWIMEKILKLRIFPGEGASFLECSLEDIQGEILLISQFTLLGDLRKGTRPSFSQAAPPAEAAALFASIESSFCARWPGRVQLGRFGADMQISLVNDGPVTLILDK